MGSRPEDPPALAVASLDGGLVAYASWNGATGVAGWDVLAGPDDAHLRKVAFAPRKGFETVVGVPRLDPADRVLAVRAMGRARTSLALSPVAPIPA